jgi:hypothetical protein
MGLSSVPYDEHGAEDVLNESRVVNTPTDHLAQDGTAPSSETGPARRLRDSEKAVVGPASREGVRLALEARTVVVHVDSGIPGLGGQFPNTEFPTTCLRGRRNPDFEVLGAVPIVTEDPTDLHGVPVRRAIPERSVQHSFENGPVAGAVSYGPGVVHVEQQLRQVELPLCLVSHSAVFPLEGCPEKISQRTEPPGLRQRGQVLRRRVRYQPEQVVEVRVGVVKIVIEGEILEGGPPCGARVRVHEGIVRFRVFADAVPRVQPQTSYCGMVAGKSGIEERVGPVSRG